MRKFAVVLNAGLFALAAHAGNEVFKWTDADGNVHYGDKPKSEKSEPVTKKPGELPEAPSDPAADKAAADRAAACEAKKKQLDSYKKATVINETDSFGNTRQFSAAEKEKLLAVTEKQVAEACAPPAPTVAK